MVGRILVPIALLISAPAAGNGTVKDAGSPHALKAGQISQVHIDENGAWTDRISGHETPEMCGRFLLTEADVREFVTRARGVGEQTYVHELPAAMCYGEGRLTLQDGASARWHIEQARRGFIAHADGTVQYLYCRRCTAAVFAPR